MAVSPSRIRSISFLPSSHRQCRQCLRLKIRRIDTGSHAAPASDVLGRKHLGPMTELYVFRGTTGHAETVTDDKSGKKLPSHSFGELVFSRTINVVTKTRLTVASTARRSSQM